jgi:predicted amidophosphoribosyltransferase
MEIDVFVVVVVVVALVLIAKVWPMPGAKSPPPQVCKSCGAAHPSVARFCRQCGKEL